MSFVTAASIAALGAVAWLAIDPIAMGRRQAASSRARLPA
jgi:hypothetical protein